MSRSDKWMWCCWWPLAAGALVGFGALGPGSAPVRGLDDMIACGACVAMAIGMGVALGLRVRGTVSDSLTQWAVGAEALYEQEAQSHERTADVLFDLAYGLTDSERAQSYLAELDIEDAEEESTPETEPH